MNGETFVDRKLRELGDAVGEERQFVEGVMDRIGEKEPGAGYSGRRLVMRQWRALAAAAVVLFAVVLGVWILDGSVSPAYAIEQTVQALQNVRFLHIVSSNGAGQTTDERWIEIGMAGRQVRYRQEHPLSLLVAFERTGEVSRDVTGDTSMVSMAIEDGEATALYHYDKKSVILYDREDQQFQWVGDLGGAFENLLQKGKILEENVEYEGKLVHKVWWPALSSECYVDPKTKLPITIGGSRLSYEVPAAGTFEIVIPEGYAVLDKRKGAAAVDAPDWLADEENAQEQKRKSFNEGARALARGDYAGAARLLQQSIGYDSWARFWLGNAYYKLGQYDLAIENYNKLLDIAEKAASGEVVAYCRYARALAYDRLGMKEDAAKDFADSVPAMIRTLRIPSGGTMFEYADNPLIRYGQQKPGNAEIVANMIARLRIATGQNFGYDPNGSDEQKEAAIAAWEQWYAEFSGGEK